MTAAEILKVGSRNASAKQRAKIRAINGSYSLKEIRERALVVNGYKCAVCGKLLACGVECPNPHNDAHNQT